MAVSAFDTMKPSNHINQPTGVPDAETLRRQLQHIQNMQKLQQHQNQRQPFHSLQHSDPQQQQQQSIQQQGSFEPIPLSQIASQASWHLQQEGQQAFSSTPVATTNADAHVNINTGNTRNMDYMDNVDNMESPMTYDHNIDKTIHLPAGFQPRRNDVVCARGKSWWDHDGNRRYRSLIAASTPAYAKAVTKLEKSVIVSNIVEKIRKDGSNSGSFVKKERNGDWVNVTDNFAREKVSQSLRDNLHGSYRSSTRAKKRRRDEANEKLSNSVEKILKGRAEVSASMQKLADDVKSHGHTASDSVMIKMFEDANKNMLNAIKNDADLLRQYEGVLNNVGEDDAASTGGSR